MACVILAGKLCGCGAHAVGCDKANVVAAMQNAVNCGKAKTRLMGNFLMGEFWVHAVFEVFLR